MFLASLVLITTIISRFFLFTNFPISREMAIVGFLIPYSIHRLVFPIFAVGLTYFLLSKLVKGDYRYVLFFVLLSPFYWLFALQFPISFTIVFFVLFIHVYLFLNFGRKIKIISAVVFVLFTIVFAQRFWPKSNPSIYEIFDKEKIVDSVTNRFLEEDVLQKKIELPYKLRRVTYNKVSFVSRDLSKYALSYFSLENFFFIELNPSKIKFPILFFWPAVFLLPFILLNNSKPEWRKIFALFLFSFIYYLFSSGELYWKLFPSLFALSALLGVASRLLLNNKIFLFGFILLYLFGAMGWSMLYKSKPMEYLDNRQFAYSFFFKDRKVDTRLTVADILGSEKTFCQFYLGESFCSKVEYNNFGRDARFVPGEYYAGFAGNFLGMKEKEKYFENWKAEVESMGFEIVDSMRLADNIANGYGQVIILAKKQ